MRFWFGKDKTTETSSQAAPTQQTVAVEAPAVPMETVPAASAPVPPAVSVSAPVQAVAPTSVPPAPSVSAPGASAAPERQQVNQRDLYCSLMNALYDAVMVLDEEGHVVDCNNRVEALFGYTEDDMWDRPAKDIIKGFGPQLLAKLAAPLREHRPVIIDGSCVRKDGTVFAAEITVGNVRLARGENIVVSIRDVEKRMVAVMERLRSQGLAPARPSVVRLVPHGGKAREEAARTTNPV